MKIVPFLFVLLPAAASAAEIAVFKQPNFSGETLALRGGTMDLSPVGFHDQISSIVVRDHPQFAIG